MVVGGVCLLVVLIGRLGRHGAGLDGVLNEVPAAAGHKLGPPAVQCESRALPNLLEEDERARPVVDVEELGMLIGKLREDQIGVDVECVGQFRVRTDDEAQGLHVAFCAPPLVGGCDSKT